MLKNKNPWIFLYLFLSLLFSEATIVGKISDSDTKDPLVGVNVILLETTRKLELDKLNKTVTVQTSTNYGASTDIEGEFIIKDVPFGEYDVRAMYIGYKNNEVPITINENRSYTVNIDLIMSDIALEETKVTAIYERD